ncbi:hypothetical protein N510_000899 [Firmicutes bacterium ASF500]|nr:hypothetical protein N510_000899 [Firmicutes bacterium ASF500]
MEHAQRELVRVLLETVYTRGLLSKNAYLNAVDLVYSVADIPPFFWYPVCLAEEASGLECAPGTP